jgi:hypothetical protein
MAGFPDILDIEDPRVAISWSDTFDEVLAKVHQGPVRLDPSSGGRCVLKNATLLGLKFRMTLRFDSHGRMSHVLLERSIDENEADGQLPETIEDQLRRHRTAIAGRRAALEQHLGPGTEDAGPPRQPLRSARWTSGDIVTNHRISWNVERGGDERGYLADSIELSRVVGGR